MSKARLAFLGFAILGIGLTLAGLSHVSGRIGDLSATQSTERLTWGRVLFETSGRLAQSYRTAALAVAAADPAMAAGAGALSDSAPTLSLAEPVRRAVPAAMEKLPAELRRAAFFLVGNDKGVALIPADGSPGQVREDKNAFNLASAGAAGPQGAHALVEGKLYRVAAAPLRVIESGGEKSVGWLGAAFPLDDAFAGEVARDLNMSVTLIAQGVVASSLPAAERSAMTAVKDGAVPPASPIKLGPIGLPAFVDKPVMAEAKTFPLEGVEGARAVLVAQSESLHVLGEFQSRALLGILALLVLVIPVLVMVPAGAAAQPEEPVRAKPARRESEAQFEREAADRSIAAAEASFGLAPAKPAAAQPATPPPIPSPAPQPAAVAPAPAPAAAHSPGPVPAASPDDFPFGPAATATPAATPPAPPAAPPPAAPQPPPAATPFQEAMVEKPFDPFAAASLQSGPLDAPTGESTVSAPVPEELLRASARAVPLPAPPTSEATVVQAVPDELLRASARRTAPGTAVPLPAPGGAPAGGDESHFQDVFQQFLATRTQCNEPSDGLTFDKFAAKLRKNREQLIQKYSCKSVRFQVYVKDGKAALKATPVRD